MQLAAQLVAMATGASALTAGPLPPVRAAVIIPGFLSDARDFESLAAALSARGLPTAVVPMPLWHWIPMVGGRSLRPMLERLDHAVRHVAVAPSAAARADPLAPLPVPPIGYGVSDLWRDFVSNPGGVASVGGSPEPDEYPDAPPAGTFPAPDAEPAGRVALIGHSAGGTVARIYLSERAYGGDGGRAYSGARLVHSLVTLGTPHFAAEQVPFVHVAWADREPPPRAVRLLAVGARGWRGDSSGALTRGSYAFCARGGEDAEKLDGDGVTPLGSATSFAGAEKRELDGVLHYPFTAAPLADVIAPELTAAHRAGTPWYGSEGVIDEWLPWVLEGCGD